MSKKSKNIARFIRAAMGKYPNLRPFAAVTHYGAWLMSENKRLKELPMAYSTQTDKARAVPVVRCGECKWSSACKPNGYYLGQNGFCSRGARMNEKVTNGNQIG